MPRATTAACDVMPPCAVRTPRAWIRPWMSSGVVSQRTRITSSPVLATLFGGVGVEDDRTRGRSGRCVQAARRDLDLRARVDPRVEELVELRRIDARDCLVARDQLLVDHFDRDPQRGGGGSLAGSRLQDEETAFLDRELDVLQVPVVRLEERQRLQELVERLGHPLAHQLDRLGRADPGDDVLALRVREELAIEPLLARRGIAREADAGSRALASVAEDHLDDVHRGAEIVRDVVRLSVDLRPWRVPRVEDRAIGASQLLGGVLRERVAGALLVDLLERLDETAEVVGGELDVLGHPARRLQVGERLLEAMPVDTGHHAPVHLDEPAVGVECEARVAGRRRQTLDGDVVQAEVQDRVHHPGHRDRRAGADGDEQWALRVSEAAVCALLERRDALLDLAIEALGHPAVRSHVRAAGVRRDREPGRNRDPELGHLRKADALATEELAPAPGILVEVEDVAHLREESTRTSGRAGTRMVTRSSCRVGRRNRVLVCHRCDTGLSLRHVVAPELLRHRSRRDRLRPPSTPPSRRLPARRRARGVHPREDAERFIEEVRGDDPELASSPADRGAPTGGGRGELVRAAVRIG